MTFPDLLMMVTVSVSGIMKVSASQSRDLEEERLRKYRHARKAHRTDAGVVSSGG